MHGLRATVTGHDRRGLWRHLLSGAVFGAVPVAMFAFAAVAFAQEPAEVPIGTFQLKSPSDGRLDSARPPSADRGAAGDPGAAAGSDEPGAWFFQRYESGSPEALEATFKDALAALNAGRSAEAQRLLERLVSEAPRSVLADKARRYLATLYREQDDASASEETLEPAEKSVPRAPTADQADVPQQRAAADVDTRRPAAGLGGPRGSAVPVSAALEEQFVSEAGDRVFFSSGSSELGTRARGVLQAQARFILRRPDLTALIEGHADDGPEPTDQDMTLSQARATAVRERLIAEGIRPEKIAVVARGREDPVSNCPDPSCAAQNRRAITVLMNARGAGYLRRSQAADLPGFEPSKTPATQ